MNGPKDIRRILSLRMLRIGRMPSLGIGYRWSQEYGGKRKVRGGEEGRGER